MKYVHKLWLEAGRIKNNKNQQLYSYTIRVLTQQDLPSALALYDFVVANMADPDMLWRYPDEIVADFFGPDGIVAGVFVEQQLVGFRVFYFHREGDLTNPLLYNGATYGETAHLALCVIHSDFRGNSLQKQLGVYLLEVAQATRTFHTMCSVVSPHNYPSINDKISLNMVVVKLMPKFRGIWRYIFYRNMNTPTITRGEKVIFVPSFDYPKQIELLEMGYYGVQIGEKNGQMGIFLEK